MACSKPEVLSLELIYGVRLVTLLSKATKVLRAEFHNHFTTDPLKLYLEIKQKHGEKLELLLKQKVIHKSEYYILLPASGKTNSLKFDLSLLIFALITICPIQEPVTGWKALPLPSDRSKGANFNRLRNDRNKILHTYFEFEETSFTSIWNRIISALEELGCDKKELLDLKSASLDPSLKVDYEKNIEDLKRALKHVADLEDSVEGVTYNLFSPIPSFTGREEEILEVHQRLITKDEKHIAMVIHGLGGVGKSELVRQYCNRFTVSYYKGNVIWINGESKNTMTEDFCNVAERISLNTRDEDGRLLSIRTIVSKVYRFFADRPVLFVFDNVTNKTSLMEFMEMNRSINVSILITTQFTVWSERFIQLRTDVFSQNDAFAFVSQNVNKKYTLTDHMIMKLCEKMQYLPLALQQSIAYIKIWAITIGKYLEEFEHYADQILEINESDEMYNKTVKTTWNMALDKLKNSKLAITLINFMSFLDGKNIKKELFYECFGEEHKVREALQLLQQYSLIFITTFHDDLEQTIQMHSLVQYVIRIESKQKYLQQFLDTIFHPLDDDCDIEHESYGKYWYYQLAYMFHQTPNCNILAFKISKYLTQLQTIFSSKGKYTMLYEIAILLEIFQKNTFGYNNKATLNTGFVIALCLQFVGNYDEALIKYQEVEKLQIETIGYKHPCRLRTQHSIALCLQQKRNYDEALTKYQEVEKLQIQIVGYKHSDGLVTQNNIAICLMLKGYYDLALAKYQEVEKLLIETLGYKHLNTLITQHNIAQCLQEKGNYDEALSRYQRVEKLLIETIGYKHPDTLTTQHSIAQCLQLKGNYDEALTKYQEMEKLQSETVGYKHPDILKTRISIAQCLQQKGYYDDALTEYQDVEKLQEQIIFYKNPNYRLVTQDNIAICLVLKGCYDLALTKFREVEKLNLETFGYKHSNTLTTQRHIAQCLQQKGNYDEALSEYRRVENLLIATIGYKRLDTLTTQHSIAKCLQLKENYVEALTKYREVEKLQIETIGYKHPNTLTTQHNIAQCLQQNGNYDEALTIYHEVKKLRIETIGYEHPSTLAIQLNIILCLFYIWESTMKR